ncbi:hypothetical protein [Nocardia sp. NPDC051981]|uniref:SMP-30/gluconolactonase/LRE family protein n=1 Tax=Nocardia sp. NPDC051981 TaxID=3155417 RepID=UPI003421C01E
MGIRESAALACAMLACAALSSFAAAPASAAPVCPGAGQPTAVVASLPGAALEGLTMDRAGRAFVTDLVSGHVFRIDAPGAPAVPIAKVPSGGAGALAWLPDGRLLVGYGADPRVFVGDALRQAGIVTVDPDTGAVAPFATGLSAADGMDVAHDGTVYATNDFGSLVGRVDSNGVQPNWASFPSANGAVLDQDDSYLYVSRTFVNPGVSRIPTNAPWAPQSLLDLSGGDLLAAPDGLTLDSLERPVLPFNSSGQVVRIDAPGRYCVLGSGPQLTSEVQYGRGGQGFSAGRLFGITFSGMVYEIPGGFDPDARTAVS